MKVTTLKLKNWRNFLNMEAEIGMRCFVVGPNASGKSNLLDVFRFLGDVAKDGFAQAIEKRGGLSKIRCLSARKDPVVKIDIILEDLDNETEWGYVLGIRQEQRGFRRPIVAQELVYKNGELILERPDKDDKSDSERLIQTHLEQINTNSEFRILAEYFARIQYLHLIPQMIRYPAAFRAANLPGDPFGKMFIFKVAETPERTRSKRLRIIQSALQMAVPHLKQLSLERDKQGTPHLEAVYEHWRPMGAKQQETQFSDGTLRLIALLWSLLEGESLLLLEEPEISLHAAIVTRLAGLISRMQSRRKRQVIVSTHSMELLSDKGIAAEEVLMLNPTSESTKVTTAKNSKLIKDLLTGGISVAEIVRSHTQPKQVSQLSFWDPES